MGRPGEQCWQSGDYVGPVDRTHERADPDIAAQSLEELYVSTAILYWMRSETLIPSEHVTYLPMFPNYRP